VWTTGSSEGNGCDTEKTFAWCLSGKLFNDSQVADARYWITPPDGSASSKRCLELNYDASKGATLASADCSTDKKPFICQVLKHLSLLNPGSSNKGSTKYSFINDSHET
jgi:hypothetical protein